MNRELLIALALSLAMTLVLECAFFFATGKRDKKDLLLVVMANILTNPPVVLLYSLSMMYTGWERAFIVIPLEAAAVLTEGYCYKKYGCNFKRGGCSSA